MLFKKPAVFIFKKKLTSINSLSTKYVKNLKLQNFNYDNKIKFVLNKAEIVPNLFNQLLKQKSRHFKNVILNK